MSRGRLQALFRYLPDQTYNWQDRQGSFMGTSDVDTRAADIPKVWLKRPLRRLLTPFVNSARAAGVEFRGPQVIEAGDFEILEPRKLRGEFFPSTFVCARCARFRVGEDPRHARCGSCHSPMEQWSFVEYHKCGYISGLEPPRCANHCRADMRLMGRESRSAGDWTWECSRCNLRAERGVYRGCPQCRSGRLRVLRADANAVFYPQYIKVVNPPTESEFAVLDSDAVYPAAVAQGIGRLPATLDGLRLGVNDTSTDQSSEQARQELMEQFDLTAEEAEELLERRRRRAEAGGDWRGAVDALGLDVETLEEIGEECIEVTLSRAASPLTFPELVGEATRADLRELYVTDYPAVLARYGLAEVTLLREFPLAYIVAGYTREKRLPDEPGVSFNFFPTVDGTFPMYGQRILTEGLLFQLDASLVVQWLADSGVVGHPGTEVDPRAWLFSTLAPVESIFEEPADTVTAAVLGLVHTFSHRVIRVLAARAGLKPESLSEHLLPFNLSFIIYADTRSEFVLGGLEHVFRNYLSECLEPLDEGHRCVFDPPCHRRTGACAVCTFLSENSCERFNSALSRHYLFGGEHGGIQWANYWNR